MATRKGDALAGIGLLGCCRVHSGVVLAVDSAGDGFAKARADSGNPPIPISAQEPVDWLGSGLLGGSWCRLQSGQFRRAQEFWLCSHLFEHVGAWVIERQGTQC